MKRLVAWALAALGVTFLATSVSAQTFPPNASVLSSCGSASYVAGTANASTQNTTGEGCGSAVLRAGTAIIGKVGIDQTTPGTTNRVVTGENVVISNQLTVTTGSAYTAGDSLGGLQSYSSFATTGGSLGSIEVFSLVGDASEVDAFFFNANPTASTCTDKTAFALAAADASKVVAVVQISSSVAAGTPTVRSASNIGNPFSVNSLWACYVTRGTPTFAAGTDTQVQLNMKLQ